MMASLEASDIIMLLSEHMTDAEIDAWFDTPLRSLGHMTPMAALLAGLTDEVRLAATFASVDS